MTLRKTVPVLSLLVIGLFAMLSLLSPKASAIGKQIFPLNECKIVLLQPDITGDGVPDPTGIWKAVFGYHNRNRETIDNVIQPGIEAGGPNNYFNVGHNNSSYNPDQSVADKGQPDEFLTGRRYNVFSVDFPEQTAIGWYLKYGPMYATWANSYSPACNSTIIQQFVDPSEWYLYGI
ncbi:MAG: hypothetical protein HC932_00475 [Thermales bacterium]|nr:hypothetical protein [Thermales bacterium]